jgi:ATP-dependent RNA helicase DDX23/PRP28
MRISSEQPKFLSKEERAKLALEKRQKEVEEQRKRQEQTRREHNPFVNSMMDHSLKRKESNSAMNEDELSAIRVRHSHWLINI